MSSFLITGASGLVGKNLIRRLLREGHKVKALVRTPSRFHLLPKEDVFQWNHYEEPSLEAFKGTEVIVNLAGEGIADKRWSKKRKEALVESRVMGTKNLLSVINKIPEAERPKTLISGSAVGIYGSRQEEELDETSLPGDGFLVDLCRKWESEALKVQSKSLRVILLRTGIVLSKEGGALAKMPPVVIGDGQDWMSWIHIDDMVEFIIQSSQDTQFSGAYNLVSPNPVRNKDFIYFLTIAKKIPLRFYSPKFLVNLGLGEMASALTSSLKVFPKKALEHGFKFKHPEISEALLKVYNGDHFLDNYLVKEQFVPFSPEEIFPFFCKAENLEDLTPPWLNFKIVKKSTEQIEKGTLIDYKLKVRGLPIRWKTLISEWFPGRFFIDEQLSGPYKKWHHEHRFEKVQGGTIIRDEVTYQVPGGILGLFFLKKLISKDVETIFSFRQNKIYEYTEKNPHFFNEENLVAN